MDSDPRSSIIEAMPPRDAAETLVEIARGASGGDVLGGEQLQAAALADMKAPAASNILAHMTFKVGSSVVISGGQRCWRAVPCSKRFSAQLGALLQLGGTAAAGGALLQRQHVPLSCAPGLSGGSTQLLAPPSALCTRQVNPHLAYALVCSHAGNVCLMAASKAPLRSQRLPHVGTYIS